MQLSAIWSVYQFERKRTATTTRWLWWSILAFFPIAITGFIRLVRSEEMSVAEFSLMIYLLIPAVVCIMGQILWATPTVQSELEGKTWSFLALRPHGKIHILLGKYLTSVTWTFLAAIVSLTIVLFVTTPKVSHFEMKVVEVPVTIIEPSFDNSGVRQFKQKTTQRRVRRPVPVEKMSNSDRVELWWIMATLSFLSCLNYGALFCLLGIIVPRRAMVFAISYTIIIEFVVGLVPAIINQLTIQFRLRSSLMNWAGEELNESMMKNFVFQFVKSDVPQWQHIGILLLLFPFLLAAAAYILHQRELIASEDVN